MNTIMNGLGRCNSCGRTVRWMDNPPSAYKIMIDPETTSPEETAFNEKVHTPHWRTCQMNQVTAGNGMPKNNCGCGE